MTLDFGFYFFSIFKNSSYLFSMKRIGNSKSLQHFLSLKSLFLGGTQEAGASQISCVLQYEKGPFFSDVSCGSITGEKLKEKKELFKETGHLKLCALFKAHGLGVFFDSTFSSSNQRREFGGLG